MVDNQWAKLGPNIEAIVRSVTPKPITHTINTHYHFDHTNGNKYFGKKNVVIVAHKNLATRLASDQNIAPIAAFGGKLFQRATDKPGLPTLIFSDTLEIRDANETISILHFKGAHTDGDAIVHFKNADIFCTGDIFITYGIPFIDEDNGGDIYATLQTIDALISAAKSGTRFIPGHGPVCTVQELVTYKKLLTGYKDQVVSLMKNGLSLDKIIVQVKVDQNIGGFRDDLIPHIYQMALRHEKLK
jgi:cyclase